MYALVERLGRFPPRSARAHAMLFGGAMVDRNVGWVRVAQVALVAAMAGLVVLHLLPRPLLHATTGELIPYDPRVNFLSELVRTQYGSLMTACFVALAVSGATGSIAVHRAGLRREAVLLGGAAVTLALLALLPSDLAELRTDASTCGDPTRIEPCTWVGRAHDILPNALFLLLGAVWLSLVRYRRAAWARVVWAGVLCAVVAIVLAVASRLYVADVTSVQRIWIGATQRSVIGSAIVWLWIFLAHLARIQKEDAGRGDVSRITS